MKSKIKISNAAAAITGISNGRVTRIIVCHRFAPNVRAACSKLGSKCDQKSPTIRRTIVVLKNTWAIRIAERVFVIEPLKARRDLAAKTGAEAVFDPADTDPGKEIAKRTDGLRVDIAFDCVGNQSSFDTAVKVTGRRATICVVGLALKPIQVPFIRLWGHEKTVNFSSGYEEEFPAAIPYLADKRVRVEELISDRIALEDLVSKGVEPLIHQGEKYIKVLVYP